MSYRAPNHFFLLKLSLASLAVLFLFSFSTANLLSIYKKGEVQIGPDSMFGLKTDWQDLFIDRTHDIAIGPDGSIFISNPQEDAIFKLDSYGNVLKKYGTPGQGPGDLTGPFNLSILDGMYLVVGEHMENRRISLFDLAGNFKKLIITQDFATSALALKNGIIACLLRRRISEEQERWIVSLIDIRSGKKSDIVFFDKKAFKGNVSLPELEGQVLLEKTKEGNLVVGFTVEPTISIYNTEGKCIKRFDTKLNRIKISALLRNECYKNFENIDRLSRNMKKIFMSFYKRSNLFIPEYAPYYEDLKIDGDGNILIFPHNICSNVKSFLCQIYSELGERLGGVSFRFMNCSPADGRLRGFKFYNSEIYGFIENPKDEYQSFRLIRCSIGSHLKK